MKIKWKSIGIEELAAIVSDKLNENGIDAILVGGACAASCFACELPSFLAWSLPHYWE